MYAESVFSEAVFPVDSTRSGCSTHRVKNSSKRKQNIELASGLNRLTKVEQIVCLIVKPFSACGRQRVSECARDVVWGKCTRERSWFSMHLSGHLKCSKALKLSVVKWQVAGVRLSNYAN